MELADVIPWVWCAVALVAAWRSHGGGRAWWGTAVFALLLASLHLWRWNKPVYEAGRQLLIDSGVYDERIVFKVALGLVFFAVFVWIAWRAWRWSRCIRRLHRVVWIVMVADALYVTVRTLSIDGWMPDAMGVEPGRSLLGLLLAGAALLAAVFGGGPPPEVDDAGF